MERNTQTILTTAALGVIVFIFVATSSAPTLGIESNNTDKPRLHRTESLKIRLQGQPSDGLEDQDGDCLSDDLEHELASLYAPLFVFDSRENARTEAEPLTLYQATPRGGDSQCRSLPDEIEIRYTFLFLREGGYPASSGDGACGRERAGDNQTARLKIEVKSRGMEFLPTGLTAGRYQWPSVKTFFFRGWHPLVYLSAGRHNEYLGTESDQLASPYADGRCIESVDGRGAMVLPSLDSPSAPRGRLNVGERSSHAESAFVGDLTSLGFAGEHAWDPRPFCGGASSEDERSTCVDSPSMESLWR